MTTKNQLIELGSPSGEHGVYVCRECYERQLAGSTCTIRDHRGEEYSQVYRGLSYVDAECMAPDHAESR